MKRARGDEKDVIGFDGAVLRRNGGAFDQRQEIALHAFARYSAPPRPSRAQILSISSRKTMPSFSTARIASW